MTAECKCAPDRDEAMLSASLGEGARGTPGAAPDCEWKFRTLTEALHEVVVSLDGRGRVRDWNGAAEALFGYSAVEAVGKDFFGLVGRGRGAPLAGAENGDGQGKQAAFLATRKSGETFPLEMTFFSAAAGGGALGLVREPMAEGQTAALLLKDKQRLEEADRRRREVEESYAEQRQRDERLIWQLMHHDPLSGLPNRLLMAKRVAEALTAAGEEGRHVGMLVVGIHHCAYINDVLGHGVGDFILTTVAARLIEGIGPADTVARLDGDQFAVLLPCLKNDAEAEVLAQRLLEAVKVPVTVAGHELAVTASIGIAVFPRDGADADALIRNASAAMNLAKRDDGNGGCQLYAQEYDACALAQLALEEDLRRALRHGEFEIHYQPQVDLFRGVIDGAEALLRWRRPGHGLVSPASFIPLAEECGLIGAIGAWVLEQACVQAKEWQRAGAARFKMAVNLSPRQFQDSDLDEKVLQALKASGLCAESLELEITETLLMRNSRRGNAMLRHLKQQGVRLALDDFGTGYSSLNYLRRFPVDTLKIDQSFVRQIPGDDADSAIVQAIIALAHGLQLKVVAEGVETERQLGFLRGHGCDFVQGYLFSPPVEAADFGAKLSATYR